MSASQPTNLPPLARTDDTGRLLINHLVVRDVGGHLFTACGLRLPIGAPFAHPSAGKCKVCLDVGPGDRSHPG